MIQGSIYRWMCISTKGKPAPTMTLRIENIQFTTGITQTTVQLPDFTFNVTSVLIWSPPIANHGQVLSCDVQHKETGSDLQTASLPLVVYGMLQLQSEAD